MPSPSVNNKTVKADHNERKLVRKDTGINDVKERKPLNKANRSDSSKTVTVHENQAIKEEEEYLNDPSDRFEKDETPGDKFNSENMADAGRDMDEYERNMNEAIDKDNETGDQDVNDIKEKDPRRDSLETQKAGGQKVRNQNVSSGRYGRVAEKKLFGRNDSKRSITAPRKPSLTRYNSYKDTPSKVDTGRDKNTRKSIDGEKNIIIDRRQSHAIVEEEEEAVIEDCGALRGYRFNDESETYDLIDYRNEWEESPDNEVSISRSLLHLPDFLPFSD